MGEIYNLLDETVLQRIIELVESSENQDRKEKQLLSYEIANGAQREKIIDTLKERYPESYDGMNVVDIRIGKKILRKLSRCYSAGVKREVSDSNGIIHKDLTKALNDVYESIDDTGRSFTDLMDEANELHINHKYVEQFFYISEEDRINVKNLPPHLFTPIPNQTKTRAEVIIFENENTPLSEAYKIIDSNTENLENYEYDKSYTIWSKNFHFDFHTFKIQKGLNEKIINEQNLVPIRIVKVKNPKNQDNKNPYGIMNFVQYKEATNGHFNPLSPSEICMQSMEICIILSDLVTIAKEQGFAQSVIYYDTDTPPVLTKTGPTHTILIKNKEGRSKFEYASANPDLKGHLDVALAITRILLSTNDLSTDKVSGELGATQFASGIDRLIADSEVISNIEDQRKYFRRGEQKALEIVQKLLAYMIDTKIYPEEYQKVNRADLDKKYKINLHYNPIKPIISEKDKAETIVFLDENGLILPHEKHSRFNENLSEQDAIKREKLILEHKEAKRVKAMEDASNQANEEIKEAYNNTEEVGNNANWGQVVNESSKAKGFIKQKPTGHKKL